MKSCPAVLVLAVALLVSMPTHADTVADADAITPVGTLDKMMGRADRAIAKALPLLFENGDVMSRFLPAPSGGRHSLTIGQLTFHPTKHVEFWFGGGMAAIVDAPHEANLPGVGIASGAGISYIIARPHGFKVDIEANTLHVRYGSMSLTDETMLFGLSIPMR